MDEKKIGRREFLKLALASAAAAGLSHFRVLNFGSIGVAFADQDDDCINPGDTDICEPLTGGSIDSCKPYPPYNDWDICDPDPNLDPQDFCILGLVGPGAEDMCYPSVGDTDYGCGSPPPDICDPAGLGDPDLCAPPTDPDECQPVDSEDFACTDTDTCDPPGDPDYCAPWAGERDECAPADPDPTDDPTVVDLESFTARPAADPASSALPALGGLAAAAALGAAALDRRRSSADEPRPDEPEVK